MAFKLTNSKEVAIRAFIHEWLKDDTRYCNGCGTVFVEPPEGCAYDPCCDKVHIGANLTFLWMLIQENKQLKESRANAYASNQKMTMRWGLSMTPRLLHDLEQYSMNTLKEPLFKDSNEMSDFMKAFPQFRVCEKV